MRLIKYEQEISEKANEVLHFCNNYNTFYLRLRPEKQNKQS